MFFFTILTTIIFAQDEHESKIWCRVNCDPELHTENTKLIYGQVSDEAIVKKLEKESKLCFPVRFAFVRENKKGISKESKKRFRKVIEDLNYAFINSKIKFKLNDVVELESTAKLEDLSENSFNMYNEFSNQYDLESQITVYIMDHRKEFCTVSESGIRCSKIGGFSYILSSVTNNIVMSNFDVKNSKVVAHEFGHFFGLYHTFEEHLFGKDEFNQEKCSETGDLICDTPPDPGVVFEIYVNHTACEMDGFKDDSGNEYKPILQNYMSYYKPCYLKENLFTPQQELIISLSSRLNIRKRLSR